MRRFELVEGTANKFWEVALEGADVTVRFGRIGTNGQTRTKTHASDDAARKDHDKLVREKTAGGYSETGVAAGATLAAVPVPAPVPVPLPLPAPAPAPAPSSVPVSVLAPPERSPTARSAPIGAATSQALPTAAATGAADIVWPSGGFDWTDALRAALPLVRGIRVAAVPDGRTLLATPIMFAQTRHVWWAKSFDALAAAMGRSWRLWDPASASQMIQPERLGRDDPELWLELCAQCLEAQVSLPSGQHDYARSYALTWLTHVGIALHGLPFMVERALDFARGTQSQPHALDRLLRSMFGALRAAIAAAGAADHDTVVALLEKQAGSTSFDRLLRAQLCPHRQDWVEGSLDDDIAGGHLWLRDAVASAESMRRYFREVTPHYHSMEPPLLLQLQLHDGAAFDLIADLLRRVGDRENTERFTALLLRLRDPRTIVLLAQLIERKESRAALDKLSVRFPAAVLKAVVDHALASRSRLAEGWAVRLALREPVALAQVMQALDAAPRLRLQALLDVLDTTDAPASSVPPLLREPPWLGTARAAELPTLAQAPLHLPDRFTWSAEEAARHAARKPVDARSRVADPVKAAFERLCIKPSGQARALAGELLRVEDLGDAAGIYSVESPDSLLAMPDRTIQALWNSYPSRFWTSYSDNTAGVHAILARLGAAAMPGLVGYVQARPEDGLAIALPVDSARLVPTALHALRNLKKARGAAIAWMRAHAETTLAVALPLAFGVARAPRDDAQFALRWLVANGLEASAREASAAGGAELVAALQALLDADPLLLLPARMPKLPGFFVAPSLRRPTLRDGSGALPVGALEHIGMMLAISKLEAPYPGLAIVKDACTPESLAEFAWDLFEAWMAAGSPSKESWAFSALGLLGTDETARRLAPRIREWPGESAHHRAVAGLDLLATIGSDVALMHLNGIAGKVKFKALQDRAREKIAVVAEARGFTSAELSDRLVPDLGLDEHGTLALDFGPRQFFVGFDETLKPFVKDAHGVRLKDLPKPIKSDDATLAADATDRYKQLKKDAKAIASLQVTRLEMSMVDRRRWPAADFRLFFLEHPLMRHLAARLVWGLYDAQDALVCAFRVAEDWTLADADDTGFTLPGDARVGLVHVIEMPAPLQAAFGQILADYEILQPFRQLGRETYTLTPQELAGAKIARFAARTIATGSVMGLVNRGWERGQAQDGGWVGWFSKRVAGDLEVQLELDPGTIVGDVSYEPKQRIPNLVLRQARSWDDNGLAHFDRLHPIVASEVLRDADLLAPFKDA
jgi:predicted DNA-binding WGR domain protein